MTLSHREFELASNLLRNAVRIMQGRASFQETRVAVNGHYTRQVNIEIRNKGDIQFLCDVQNLIAIRQSLSTGLVTVTDYAATLSIHGQDAPAAMSEEVSVIS